MSGNTLHKSISESEFKRLLTRLETGDKVSVSTSAEDYGTPFEVVSKTDESVCIATTYPPVRNRDDYTPKKLRTAEHFTDVDVVIETPGAYPASVTEFAIDT